MIISKTPLRISFVGGGTDLSSFYKKDDGAVLSTTIDKYIYVIIKERFDNLICLNYTKREIINNLAEINHDLIREAMIKTGIINGVEITTLAVIPSEGSGLGSSSSLTVGLLNAFYQYKGIQPSREKLAQEACEIEINILKRPIGKQDQYAAAYGGANEIIFSKDEIVKVNSLKIDNENLRILGSNLLLFYTNITRKADTILKEQIKKADIIFDTLTKMKDQVSDLKHSLENEDYDNLGQVLKKAWSLKKSLHPSISNSQIDEMMNKALKAGAVGGKISGAGGGGFLLVYATREKQNEVREAMKDYRELPFMIEKYGSRIIFNQMSDYWR